MSTSATAPALYEDWQKRREYLLATGAPQGRAYLDIQIHILDYLLKRYAGTSEAERPARFALPQPLYLNRRAIVVHHHLGKGEVAAVKTKEEAGERASRILQRIRKCDPQSAITATAEGASAEEEKGHGAAFGAAPQRQPTRRQLRRWGYIAGALRGTEPFLTPCRAIEQALREGPTLPEVAVAYLADRIEQMAPEAAIAVDQLLRCDNSSALEYAVLAWQARIVADGGDDEVTARLTELFYQPERREQAAEKMRSALANDHTGVRLRALAVLERIGSLDDVGLLMDVLALPSEGNEDPREWVALTRALRTLSGAEV
ncbi:MAG: hypothetical protein NTW87_22540 [Planctomycetota bacterium]|nr:hypothetical protein [Planctomycetota bacterium]